jgi:hypothetical protein
VPAIRQVADKKINALSDGEGISYLGLKTAALAVLLSILVMAAFLRGNQVT